MAEIVELRIEQMIPEFEQMQRVKLFTADEIKKLTKKRREFEHKLQRHTKCKEDYLKYIEFEVALLRDIRLRRDKFGIRAKKDTIDYVVAKRVRYLYKQVLFKFQDDIKYWLAYIKFCKSAGFTESVSQILGRMLQVHGDNPRLWHMAAMWELDEVKSPETAQQFLCRGLHFHPKSHLLFREVFRLALITAKDKPSPDTAEAEVMYNASKKIDDIDFFVSLLKVAEEYPFTAALQLKMVIYLKEKFSREELMWHTLAQRELNGYNYEAIQNSGTVEVTTPRERLKLCLQVYETAVTQLPNDKMWDLYLEAMLEINQDISVLAKVKRNMLGNALQNAHAGGFMSERHYLQWLNLLFLCEGTTDKILEIFDASTKKWKNCSELWLARLEYFIKRDDEANVVDVFEQAKVQMERGSLPLWNMMLMYYQAKPDLRVAQNIFHEALKQPVEISGPMKPQFIEWLALSKGIVQARKAYLATAENPPFCLELHMKMAALESYQLVPDIKSWRKCLELATEYFGKASTDVWINLIEFELHHGEPKFASDIYRRATATLKLELTDIFESEYSQVKNGMTKSVPGFMVIP